MFSLPASAGPGHGHGGEDDFFPTQESGAVGDASSDDSAASAKDDKWDVNNPPGDKKQITIDVDEGTWMSLDISPDGRTIAFDLLGDIYYDPLTRRHGDQHILRHGLGISAPFFTGRQTHRLHL